MVYEKLTHFGGNGCFEKIETLLEKIIQYNVYLTNRNLEKEAERSLNAKQRCGCNGILGL